MLRLKVTIIASDFDSKRRNVCVSIDQEANDAITTFITRVINLCGHGQSAHFAKLSVDGFKVPVHETSSLFRDDDNLKLKLYNTKPTYDDNFIFDMALKSLHSIAILWGNMSEGDYISYRIRLESDESDRLEGTVISKSGNIAKIKSNKEEYASLSLDEVCFLSMKPTPGLLSEDLELSLQKKRARLSLE